MRAAVPDAAVLSFECVAAWQDQQLDASASLIVLYTPAIGECEQEVDREINLIRQNENAAPIVWISDNEDPSQLLRVLSRGVQGYIPSSVPLNVAIEAMRLVRSGGTYSPISSLLSTLGKPVKETPMAGDTALAEVFTDRQTAVLNALRQGKPNKIIAYELSMCESTVKVHVRNIMKKLNATNRTEVAFKTVELFA